MWIYANMQHSISIESWHYYKFNVLHSSAPCQRYARVLAAFHMESMNQNLSVCPFPLAMESALVVDIFEWAKESEWEIEGKKLNKSLVSSPISFSCCQQIVHICSCINYYDQWMKYWMSYTSVRYVYFLALTRLFSYILIPNGTWYHHSCVCTHYLSTWLFIRVAIFIWLAAVAAAYDDAIIGRSIEIIFLMSLTNYHLNTYSNNKSGTFRKDVKWLRFSAAAAVKIVWITFEKSEFYSLTYRCISCIHVLRLLAV